MEYYQVFLKFEKEKRSSGLESVGITLSCPQLIHDFRNNHGVTNLSPTLIFFRMASLQNNKDKK